VEGRAALKSFNWVVHDRAKICGAGIVHRSCGRSSPSALEEKQPKQRSRPNDRSRRRGSNEGGSSWSIRAGTNRRRRAGDSRRVRVDGRMGSAAAGYGCAGLNAAWGSAVRPDDRDEADASAEGSGGAAVDTGAGLRNRRDLDAQPVRLPRRQGLYQLSTLSIPSWQLSGVNEIAQSKQRWDCREHGGKAGRFAVLRGRFDDRQQVAATGVSRHNGRTPRREG
jgi:hypothetical protein